MFFPFGPKKEPTLIFLIALVLGVNLILTLIAPPGIPPDPAKGFEVWRSMQHGAAWNHSLEPDLSDLSRDREIFVSWWTPGQYLLPGMLTGLFGISLGLAATLVTFVALAAGTVGWYRLYREFSFSEKVAPSPNN